MNVILNHQKGKFGLNSEADLFILVHIYFNEIAGLLSLIII
jgi:hypothetical protein